LRLFLSFNSALLSVLALWAFELAVAAHAVRTAVRQVNTNSTQRPRWPAYALGVLFTCIAVGVFSGNSLRDKIIRVRAFKIPSASMSPTIVSGDHLAVDMWYYKTNRPKRGDLVVYRMPVNNVLFVKRVVAIGGDTIAVDSKGTILNGQRIPEPYILSEDTTPPEDSADFGPVSIPANQFFVMGDNRNHSYDSRYLGPVDVNRLVGKPLYIYYSSGNLGRIGRTIQ